MRDHRQRPLVVFSVINCICFDQRVQKMAEVVRSLDCDITIVGRRKDHDCSKGSVPFRTFRLRMIFKKGFLFYAFFNLRLFFYLLFHRSDLLVANDLDTILPNYLVSRLKRIPLVYDSHEFYTGVPELTDRPFVRKIWARIEKSILPRVKYMITVSDSIADAYAELYGVRPVVIRNAGIYIPDIEAFSRKDLGVTREDLLLIMQGAGINIDKGAEELVEAVAKTEGVSLLIVGSGDVIPILKKRIKELHMESRIKIILPVIGNDLLRYTKAADAGMSLEKDTNLNYRYSLPNKLFDYIAAGIPVLASGLPEISGIIKEYDCGILINKITVDEIVIAIENIKANRDYLRYLGKNAVKASLLLNWNNESKKVHEFYKKILNADG
jgi:glycosyltransferase involved in cell wall biosynthesis